MEIEGRVPLRRADLIERDLGDALVLMAEDGSELHTLQGTGLFLWKLIDNKNTVGGLATALTAEYEVDAARALQDTRAFLNALGEKGLIT